jgi:hypothetical protein
MEAQILRLYTLAREVGEVEFVAAVQLAAEQEAIGADYVNALVRTPQPLLRKGIQPETVSLTSWLEAPPQVEVERALAHYERYVANPVGQGGVA